MDRIFLDANLLFSAAYHSDSGLLEFWRLKDVTLCSSRYALEEARLNLEEIQQQKRLDRSASRLELFDSAASHLPRDISLPEKDAPILLAAIEARATHLITGDMRHFGKFFGKKIAEISILLPADYLRGRRSRP